MLYPMKFLKAIAGLCVFAAALGAHAQQRVSIVGSDLLRPVIEKGLERFAKEQGLALALDMDGSVPAMKQLQGGSADIAILARPLGSEKLPATLTSSQLCSEVVYVAVNAANPLTEISLRQLASVFGEKSESAAERWSVVGMTGVWGMRPLLAFTPQISDGLSVEIFRHAALEDSGFKPNVRIAESREALYTSIATQDGAIGFFSALPAKENSALKILAVSTGRGGQGHLAFSPTMENAYIGDYPLALPFYIAYEKGKTEKVASLVHYLYSDEFSDYLSKNGFLPLPSGIRKNMTLGLDKRR